jgi:hypothetical protein
MANITPEPNYIQIEETRFRAPVSEATLTRMGASINFLLSQVPFNVQKIEFLSNTTWVAPQNALFGIVEGVGGGGGGSAGAFEGGFGPAKGGGGGSSGQYSVYFLQIIPGMAYPVTIGAGGAGGPPGSGPLGGQAGQNGGSSSFGSLMFVGGIGGRWHLASNMFYGGGQTIFVRQFRAGSMARGGSAGHAYPPEFKDGEGFREYTGGLGGVKSTSSSGPEGGAGGGAGPWGPGGNGSSSGLPGESGAPNSGAGGGGGRGWALGNTGGGNGGSGRIILWLFTKA